MELGASNNTKASKKCVCISSDVVADILIRLPPESIWKLRYACKQWLSLITSPQFIKSHLYFSTISKPCPNYSLLLAQNNSPNPAFLTCSLSLDISDSTYYVISTALGFPNNKAYKPFRITGACNGLLSIVSDAHDRLLLCNPITRKAKELPPPIISSIKNTYDHMFLFSPITYGFCYDELNDDYILVQLRRSRFAQLGTCMKIYSLRANSWGEDIRVLVDNGYKCVGYGLPLGRVLYWICERGPTASWTQLARIKRSPPLSQMFMLDTATYTYGTLEGPEYGDSTGSWGILDLDGCLGVYQQSVDKTRVDIWKMKEKTWSKIMTLPGCVDACFGHQWPVQDTVLGDHEKCNLMIYDSRNNSFIKFEIGNLKSYHRFPVAAFVGSLVDPNNFDGQ